MRELSELVIGRGLCGRPPGDELLCGAWCGGSQFAWLLTFPPRCLPGGTCGACLGSTEAARTKAFAFAFALWGNFENSQYTSFEKLIKIELWCFCLQLLLN